MNNYLDTTKREHDSMRAKYEAAIEQLGELRK